MSEPATKEELALALDTMGSALLHVISALTQALRSGAYDNPGADKLSDDLVSMREQAKRLREGD